MRPLLIVATTEVLTAASELAHQILSKAESFKSAFENLPSASHFLPHESVEIPTPDCTFLYKREAEGFSISLRRGKDVRSLSEYYCLGDSKINTLAGVSEILARVLIGLFNTPKVCKHMRATTIRTTNEVRARKGYEKITDKITISFASYSEKGNKQNTSTTKRKLHFVRSHLRIKKSTNTFTLVREHYRGEGGHNVQKSYKLKE